MRLILRLDSPHLHESAHTFTEQGGDIGRGGDCDWVLECPERLISRRHARVVFDQGGFWLCDESANGLFHNQESEPVGRGKRVAVADGDSFRMGNFLLHAQLDGASDSPPSAPPVTPPVPGARQEPVFTDPTPDLAAEPVVESAVTKPSATLVNLRNNSVIDAFVPPRAVIPEDYDLLLDPAQPLQSEPPATAVTRRLNALQLAAARALWSNLLPEGEVEADAELSPEVAAALGRVLRLALETLFALRGEFEQVEAGLSGHREGTDSGREAEMRRFCHDLLAEEGAESRLQELQQLAMALRGRHRALLEGSRESMTTVVEQFAPEKFEERFASARKGGKEAGVPVSWRDRLLRAGGLWRFYRGWYLQQKRGEYRAVHQLFEKKLLSVYQKRTRARPAENAAAAKAPMTAEKVR